MKRIVAFFLLLTLSLSLWGCGSNATSSAKPTQRNKKPSSSASGQQSNNSNNNSSNIDPNGFSSLEQIVKALVNMQTGTINKEQFRKFYPETFYSQDEYDIDDEWSSYQSTVTDIKKSLQNQYGSDYKISYNIVSYEIETDYSKVDISESDNQEFFEFYGQDLRKRCDYHVTISMTISGSITEDTKELSVYLKKIGSKWYG